MDIARRGWREENVVDADRPSDSAAPCARCGSPVPPGARHCGHCGLAVPVAAGLPRPDRLPEPSREAPGGPVGRDVVGSFRLGFDVLKRYPLMITPPLIAMAVVLVAALLFFGTAMSLFAVGGLAGGGPAVMGAILGTALLVVLFVVVAMLINLVASAVVVVMAGDALAARAPSLGAAYGAVMARLGDVVGASLLCAVIIGVASLFLLVPGLIAAVFLVFALPAVLRDDAGPLAGLRRSAVLVRDNPGRTLGLVGGMLIASLVAWLVSAALHAIPVLGHLISTLLGGVLFAYLTVVAVDVYQALPRR
jgi:hypothetical protein